VFKYDFDNCKQVHGEIDLAEVLASWTKTVGGTLGVPAAQPAGAFACAQRRGRPTSLACSQVKLSSNRNPNYKVMRKKRRARF